MGLIVVVFSPLQWVHMNMSSIPIFFPVYVYNSGNICSTYYIWGTFAVLKDVKRHSCVQNLIGCLLCDIHHSVAALAKTTAATESSPLRMVTTNVYKHVYCAKIYKYLYIFYNKDRLFIHTSDTQRCAERI